MYCDKELLGLRNYVFYGFYIIIVLFGVLEIIYYLGFFNYFWLYLL